ncbi:hypothetical protein C8R46DRAFT_1070055 [Mycena filopes]|nr:hypothetical protein C8R46DRAFT_1070055 [Mycena filopes]
MLSNRDERWCSAPSSSPPSSPTAYNDSSPASSPGPADQYDEPIPFNTSRASPPMDPFSASAKGAWYPPEYEKGVKKSRRLSPSSPSRTRRKKQRVLEPESSQETVVAMPARSPSQEENENAIWDAASSRMIDESNGRIDLEGSQLTAIPTKFVEELALFYVPSEEAERLNAPRQILPFEPPPPPLQRQFTRSITAPAILLSGVSRHDIQLYLARNQITRLPTSLFKLEKLTVLSLRGNNIKIIPPEIRDCVNLSTLNISNNAIQYLPAEILELKLAWFTVSSNPFYKAPVDSSASRGRTAVSPVVTLRSRVPSLVELAFRVLFSTDAGRASRTNLADRRIAKYYELPLCEADIGLSSSGSGKKEFRKIIPPNLRRTLDAIHPQSVDVDGSPPDDEPASLGVCPSPDHAHRESVFVSPVEERYTWERVVAGVDLGESVPLKWRGCLSGCLAFLGDGLEAEAVEDMEVDEEDIVVRAQFAGGLGAVDFEDE